MGYPLTDSSQDTLIDSMITSARAWLEGRTALSLVSKSYKAYFEAEDAEDGWFELPVSPVLADPAIAVTMNGVSTTFQQRGLKTVRICPDSVISTIAVGTSFTSYLEVVFQAGATNEQANNVLLELVSMAFNNRDSGGNPFVSLPYDIKQRIQALSLNI
jgi:hypothetical protein